jgi:hypothetical protein
MGVAAICHRPLGVWHPKNERKLTIFSDFGPKTSQASLLRNCVNALKAQMEATAAKRQMIVIEGAFKGLTSIMVHFNQPIAYDDSNERSHGEAIFGRVSRVNHV